MKPKLLFLIIALFLISIATKDVFAALSVGTHHVMMCNPKNESLSYGQIDYNNPGLSRDNDNIQAFNNSPTQKIYAWTQHAINSSMFPSLNDATFRTTVLTAYVMQKPIGEPAAGFASVHLVKPVNGINGTGSQGVSSFNTENPCAGMLTSDTFPSFEQSPFCNATPENKTWISTGNVNFNVSWNVTNATQIAINNEFENITFAYVMTNAGVVTFATKDNNAQPACFEMTYKITEVSATPPEINQNSYNMTSEGGEGCINWRTDKNLGCTTTDTTPTVSFTTNKVATCAIGISDSNYTNLGASRECSGAGTLQHTCTLIPQDELTQENSFIYIGCKDASGKEGLTSTSGSLRISIHSSDLETIGRDAIESGIQHALGSGYTIYTDQKLYARNSANNQFAARFDKVVKWFNKIWAFNFLTGNETTSNPFNITPVMYVLELTNSTNSSVNSTVYQLIINTK